MKREFATSPKATHSSCSLHDLASPLLAVPKTSLSLPLTRPTPHLLQILSPRLPSWIRFCADFAQYGSTAFGHTHGYHRLIVIGEVVPD
ncbi:MAG UNVERIFIED_CONTAM: hypothetical protein LVT10_21030 [Anaerolineae bacterium]